MHGFWAQKLDNLKMVLLTDGSRQNFAETRRDKKFSRQNETIRDFLDYDTAEKRRAEIQGAIKLLRRENSRFPFFEIAETIQVETAILVEK